MTEAYRQSWLRTFDIKTRMDKETYIRAMLMHVLIAFLPGLILGFLEVENVLSVLVSLFFTLSLFPIVSSTVQRLHDVGKSGWNLLFYWFLGLCLIGWVLFGLQIKKESQPEENKWGCPAAPRDGQTATADPLPSFVDERLTQKDVEADRWKLIKTIFKIIIIYVIITVGILLFFGLESYVAPYV